MGMVGAGEQRNDNMYSPQTSNMMARAVGLHSNAAASAPTNTSRLGMGGGSTSSSGQSGGRRADLLSMLGKGPKTGAPMTTSALTARLGQAGRSSTPTAVPGPPTDLAERLAQAGLAPPTPVMPLNVPKAPVPEIQTELAALRADSEGLSGVIGSQAAEIRTLTGQLSEVATLRNDMAELRQQMRAVQLGAETERRQAVDARLIKDIQNLQEFVAQMDNDSMLEMLSMEVSNACSTCRATTRENTIEYMVEHCPSVRGGEEDDAILSHSLEGLTSLSIPAGQEMVLVYPMYTRDLDEMGAEVFMRRRIVDPETAQMSYTYVKVLGSYGNDTIQYVSGFTI
jgi:hypothetical protein